MKKRMIFRAAVIFIGLIFVFSAYSFAAPPIWETDIGPALDILTGEDDSEVDVALSFNFPFNGVNYTTVYVGTNGALQLMDLGDSGDIDYDYWSYLEEFLSDSYPIIAPFNTDLDLTLEGTIHFNDFGDRAVFTWNEVGTNSNEEALSTFQVQLYDDGTIIFGYNGILDDPSEDLLGDLNEGIVVGVTPSNIAQCVDPGTFDLNGGAFSDGTTIHQRWCYDEVDTCECESTPRSGPLNTAFDLDQQNIVFTPIENGFQVSDSFLAGIDSMSIPAETQAAGFRMFSLTVTFANSAATSVIGVDYASNNYRIADYDPATGGYITYDNLNIYPGRAYWILAMNGLNFNYSGVPVSTFGDVDVLLRYNSSTQNGWNQIGCPNAKNYYWEDVQVVDGSTLVGDLASLAAGNSYIDIRIWDWQNGSYVSYEPFNSFLLEKNNGYWVKAIKDNITLRFRHSVQVASLSTPETMFASLVNKGKRWMKKWIFTPRAAIADSNDSPPMPMGGFDSSTQGGGGCFIATAAYGHSMAPHVTVLREFRDRFLLVNAVGKAFVNVYYACAPPVADFIRKHDNLRTLARLSLLPIVGVSWTALKIGPVYSLAFMLLLCSVLIGFVGFRQKFKK
jgi:hypothetical protein